MHVSKNTFSNLYNHYNRILSFLEKIHYIGKYMGLIFFIILKQMYSMSLQETSLQFLEKYKNINEIYLSQPQ